jgi:hypothetical protein
MSNYPDDGLVLGNTAHKSHPLGRSARAGDSLSEREAGPLRRASGILMAESAQEGSGGCLFGRTPITHPPMALAGGNLQALRAAKDQTHGAWRGMLCGFAQLRAP